MFNKTVEENNYPSYNKIRIHMIRNYSDHIKKHKDYFMKLLRNFLLILIMQTNIYI